MSRKRRITPPVRPEGDASQARALYAPLNYDKLNTINNCQLPPGVHTSTDATTAYYQRMLFQRVSSHIEILGSEIIDNWDKNYIKWFLLVAGYLPILKTDKYGIIPQYGTVYGIGLFYQPNRCTISTPFVQEQGLKIGEDCEVLRFTPDWLGIWDIVQTYAELLSLCNASASSSLINSRVAYVMAAKNRSAATTLKVIFDKIFRGEPAVVYDGTLLQDNSSQNPEPWEMFTRGVKESYVSNLALADYDKILRNFDVEIGAPALMGGASDKKERLITGEVETSLMSSSARAATWVQVLEESVKRINTLYPELNLRVEYRWDTTPDMEVTEDVGEADAPSV